MTPFFLNSVQWLLKLPEVGGFRKLLSNDPLTFAAFYACTKGLFKWPNGLQARLSGGYRIGQDKLVEWSRSLQLKYGVAVSGELAQALLDGLDAMDYFKGAARQRELSATLADNLVSNLVGALPAKQADGLARLSDLLGFSEADVFWLRFAIVLEGNPGFRILMDGVDGSRRDLVPTLLAKIAGIPSKRLEKALNREGALARSGLIRTESLTRLPAVSRFWVEFLSDESPIGPRLLKTLTKPNGAGGVARVADEDSDILKTLFRHKGTDILLYGSRSVDKLGLLHGLAKEAGVKAWLLSCKGAEATDWPSISLVAKRWMAAERPEDLLVIDKTPQVFGGSVPGVLSIFGFGEFEEDKEAPGLDKVLLDGKGPSTVWTVNSPKRLVADSVARMSYHCEVRRGSRKERRTAVERLMSKAGLSESAVSEILKFDGVSEEQVRNALLIGKLFPGRYGEVVVRAVEKSQKALDRRDRDEVRTPITQYSLAYLNTAGRFKPEQIIEALCHRPHASLCLYGISGAGKTQLAERIAFELGKQIVMKRASDIYDKYLGESEKRIAEMFVEAEEEDAVLLLDEADSFLRDRSQARASWEVSIVNELLQRMERFPGVFICATNLFTHIDMAALRRFTFKLEFLPLDLGQRIAMFRNETGVAEVPPDMETNLMLLQGLTPGDFATVKRQCVLLGETLTPEQWYEQLKVEVSVKRLDGYIGVPETD